MAAKHKKKSTVSKKCHASNATDNMGQAVQMAKATFAREGTDDARKSLIDASCAKIESLLAAGRLSQARSAADELRATTPLADGHLRALDLRIMARSGDWSPILAPLADPLLPDEQRKQLDDVIRQECIDLRLIADNEALPANHALRVTAAALWRAFASVTSGGAEEVALPDVSRRSPLASWRLLIQAIDCFYRGDDERCRQLLQAVVPGSAAERAVPLLEGALGQDPSPGFVDALQGGRASLKAALQALDQALRTKRVSPNHVVARIQAAVKVCSECAPEALPRLRQRISVACQAAGFPREKVVLALGGPVLRNSHFWHLLARSSEQNREGNPLATYLYWEELRQQARAEGSLPPQEEAVLLLHMAELLHQNEISDLVLRTERAEPIRSYYVGQPEAIRSASLLGSGQKPGPDYCSPQRLYQRACSLDPKPEAFSQWLAWEKQRSQGVPENAAEAWHLFHPKDLRPLLQLTDIHERNGRLSKAEGFLKKALQLNQLDPRLAQAELRIAVAQAVANLRKPKFIAGRLERLASLPLMSRESRPAVLAALRCLEADRRSAHLVVDQQLAQAQQALGSRSIAAVLAMSLASAARMMPPVAVTAAAVVSGGELKALARLGALRRELRLDVFLPDRWEDELVKQLSREGARLDVETLKGVTGEAHDLGLLNLAYACSGVGLARFEAERASFLFWRAASLPPLSCEERVTDGLAAALTLARRQRDQALVGEIIDLCADYGFEVSDLSPSDEELELALRRELQSPEPPEQDSGSFLWGLSQLMRDGSGDFDEILRKLETAAGPKAGSRR